MTMWAKYLWELGSLILAFMTSGHLYAAFLKDIVAPSGFFIWLGLYLLACLLHRV